MYLINSKRYVKRLDAANVLIGGVGNAIVDEQAFADKFLIPVSEVLNFEKFGTDIRASVVSESFAIPAAAFRNDTSIKSFIDNDGKLTDLGSTSFQSSGIRYFKTKAVIYTDSNNYAQPVFKYPNGKLIIELENFDRIPSGYFLRQNNNFELYIPSVVQLGNSVSSYEYIFEQAGANCTIYANEYLETCNGGGIEYDLAYAIAQGATVVFIRNQNSPNPITDLIYDSGNINFTAPNSFNGIKKYLLFKNNFFQKEFTGNNTSITAISGDKIKVIAKDIYFNESESNEITI